MRDYDPTTGRYMQADPLGLVDGASVYGYARQSPGRWVDPRGEETEKYFVRNADGSWRCVPKAAAVMAAKNGADVRVSGPGSAGAARQMAREVYGQKRAQHGPHAPRQYSHWQHKNGGRGHVYFGKPGGGLNFLGSALGAFGFGLLLGQLIFQSEPDWTEICLADPMCI
jgi:uncharacterized protein RhaS with RHS repeats